MRAVFEICRTGFDAVLIHPGRSLATIGCLVAVLLPFLAELGISKGIEQQALQSAQFGADLYVTGRILGRQAPVPVAAGEDIRGIDGVTEVVPRIVGEVLLGKDQISAVLVGVPLKRFPRSLHCVQGRLYGDGVRNELVIGTELARRLKLEVGALLPPFYHSAQGDRVSEVVGLFESDAPIWQANLVLTSFETAAAIFNEQGLATDFLVYCRPGYPEAIRSKILQLPGTSGLTGRSSLGAQGEPLTLGVTTREDLLALLPRDLLHREGIFNLHFVIAFAAAILVVLVTSGFGLAERRREVGILKATGWQTDQILLRCLIESAVLSIAAAALATLLAFAWLKGLNGYGLASLFLTGVGPAASFPIPFRLTSVPVLLALVVAFTVVLVGSLYSTWRAATAPPRMAMR
jgi:ABC-type lipoprotein release transport system permease subunit